MIKHGTLLAAAALAALATGSTASAALYSVSSTDDVEIDVQLPTTNLNSQATPDEPAAGETARLTLRPNTGVPADATAFRAEYLIFRWDSFGVGAGETVSGPGTFTFTPYFTLSVSGSANNFGDYAVHEIVGGAATWEETTVTPNSLLDGATDFASLFGPALDAGQSGASADGAVTVADNSLTISADVIQRLIDGTSSGLAIIGIEGTHFQGRGHEFATASARPTLSFETVVPEPTSLALLGLGGAGLLRRRRR